MQSNPRVITITELTHDAQPPIATVGPGNVLRGPARIPSQVLFSGANEIEIEHKGALYRLRQTSLGKLILTK